VTLAPFVQALAVAGAPTIPTLPTSLATGVATDIHRRTNGVYPSAGVGLLFFYDLVRADIARGLRDGVWRFSIDIDRSFWGVL
jgi:hypothetical protein